MALIAAPLHAFLLPRAAQIAHVATPASATGAHEPSAFAKPHGRLFILMAAGFAGHAFVLSGMSTHLLPILQRGGVSAAVAVAIGALFGPAQVLSRLADFVTGSRLHPLTIARMSMAVMGVAFVALLAAGVSPPVAAVFAVVFGASNGAMTIARGALPLAMYGPLGYGRVLGRIARPAQVLQAMAPFVLAYVIEQTSDRIALTITTVVIVLSLACFAAIKKPG